MLWFLKTSYSYINPRGLIEHLKFLRRLPVAALKFRRCMRDDFYRDSAI